MARSKAKAGGESNQETSTRRKMATNEQTTAAVHPTTSVISSNQVIAIQQLESSSNSTARRGRRPLKRSATRRLLRSLARLAQRELVDTSDVTSADGAISIRSEVIERLSLQQLGGLALRELADPSSSSSRSASIELLSIRVGDRSHHSTDADILPVTQPIKTALELASELLTEPGKWLRTPNPQFGDRRPIDLIDTSDEVLVYNALNAFQYGLF